MRIYIPPNGFIGQAAQTTANQLVGVRAARNGKRKRRRNGTAKRAPVRRKRRASSRNGKRPARLVKGSAAAKRYMAKIRRKRR